MASNLKLGSKVAAIKDVQVALGVYSATPGEPSGVFDDYTVDAVKAFQRNAGREVTGELSPEDVKVITNGVSYAPAKADEDGDAGKAGDGE